VTMKGQFPASFRAGVTFDHTLKLDQYEAPTWALLVLLRGPSSIDISSVADGQSHRLVADSAATAAWVAGDYVYSIRALSSGAVFEVESGQITILRDLAAITDATDLRTHAQTALESIEAVLAKRATQDQQRYTINNRELWRTPLGDLLKLRDYYRAEVRREKAAQRGTLFGRQVKVVF
jgi:hypothetical protein